MSSPMNFLTAQDKVIYWNWIYVLIVLFELLLMLVFLGLELEKEILPITKVLTPIFLMTGIVGKGLGRKLKKSAERDLEVNPYLKQIIRYFHAYYMLVILFLFLFFFSVIAYPEMERFFYVLEIGYTLLLGRNLSVIFLYSE